MKTLLWFVLATALHANATPAEGDKDTRHLAEGDLKTLRASTEKIVTLMLSNDKTKRLEEELKLQKVLDDIAKKNKWSPLVDTDSWARMIHESFVPTKLPKELRATSDFMQKPLPMKEADFEKRGIEFNISIPKDYKPDKLLPVVVLLPGKLPGTGPLKDRLRDWATKVYSKEFRDQFIIVVPIQKVNEKEKEARDPEWASLQRGEGADQVMWTLREAVLESLAFDPRRLFLDGDGDAVKFASYYPGIFAGVVCRGAPPEGIAGENLTNTKVLIVGPPELAKKAAEADISPLKADTITEEAGIADWLQKCPPKELDPPKIKHRTNSSALAANFWIDADVDAVDPKMPIGNYPSYEAEANRETNEIIITTNDRVRMLRLFLNDKLVDLDKPIKVIVNGATKYEGKETRELDRMFTISYDGSNGNVGAVYVKLRPIPLK
jgi:hypothetical protein